MQDLKHLTRKKRLSGFGISRINSSNKRRKIASESDSRRFRLPTGKRREQLKHLLLFLAIVLGLTPVSLIVFKKAPHAAKVLAEVLRSHLDSPLSVVEAAKRPPDSNFQTACQLLDSATVAGAELTAQTSAGETLHYTIQGDLQKRVHDFMADNQVPYGVFVAIEPSTGRILAMTAHSSVDPRWAQNAFFDLYPDGVALQDHHRFGRPGKQEDHSGDGDRVSRQLLLGEPPLLGDQPQRKEQPNGRDLCHGQVDQSGLRTGGR